MSTTGPSKPGTAWCASRTGSDWGFSSATLTPSPSSTRIGEPVTVPHWYLDDGRLDWGYYAVTGHKAQGATARRAHTVAGDGIDREWIYVTMSRGQEANTIIRL